MDKTPVLSMAYFYLMAKHRGPTPERSGPSALSSELLVWQASCWYAPNKPQGLSKPAGETMSTTAPDLNRLADHDNLTTNTGGSPGLMLAMATIGFAINFWAW